MSYAIETKKRKFERILESLTDNSTLASSRISFNSRNNTSTTSIVPSFGSASSKRRRITPTGSLGKPLSGSTTSLTTHYLPSSRHAFLERLETFRQVTKWHIPSTYPINAAEWARRGWLCQDVDTVSCPSCKERLHVDVNSDVEPQKVADEEDFNGNHDGEEEDAVAASSAILKGLVERYQEMILTAHTDVCPWRRRGCDGSIQRIEGLLNMPTAIASLQTRYESIVQDGTELPKIEPLPLSILPGIDGREPSRLQFSEEQAILDSNALGLAICGWQRKDIDIIECRHCFRSLGLWLYRGPEPAMERLDAVDSHLEYCPWRSEVAQDTELSLPSDQSSSHKQKLPGWILVYLAIMKKNNRKRGSVFRDTTYTRKDVGDENEQPQLSPEQREKKMKDLMKRIRDLKKPFNVKSLLKRKDKS